MDTQQESYQTKKEEKQEKREVERRAMQRQRLLRKLVIGGGIVAGIAVLVYGLYLLSFVGAPKGEDLSRVISIMGEEHIGLGDSLPEYNSNPPTSGPHYEQTARSGFRDEQITDQYIIHNLEHGDIWISYHPRIADEIKEELKQFAGAKVIITPRETNDTDIALAAWGRLDAFNIENNVLPVDRIKEFIKRYTNRGPEKVPGASGGV